MLRHLKHYERCHSLYRITNSGNLKKVKKLGTVNFHSGGEVPYSDYQFVGKKVYYLLDKSNCYVLKKCSLNGSKVETLGVFDKKKSQDFFNAHDFTSKSCEISYFKNYNYYTYKYIYKTKKLELVEKS